jgi:P-type E1-E2 ATPase
VIIVAGACGIAAGTPLAILGGIGRCARLGAIIKGGIHLETLGRVDTVVLDKTGTLTFGKPEVQNILAAEGVGTEELLETALPPNCVPSIRSAKLLWRMLKARACACRNLRVFTTRQGAASPPK